MFLTVQYCIVQILQSSPVMCTDLKEDKDDEDAGRGSLSVWDAGTGAGAGDYGPFGDAETRAFYEDLPDLLAMVPLSALGLTPEQVERSADCRVTCLLTVRSDS